MGTLELMLLVPIAACVLAVVVVLLFMGGSRVRPRREWWLVVLVRLIGLALGIWVAKALTGAPPGTWLEWERGAMLAPVAFGGCVVAAVVVGETVVRPRRPAGVARGSLEPRRVWDYLPKVTAVATAVGALLLLVLFTATGLTATDVGGQSRGLGCPVNGGERVVGPYPGTYYSVPVVLGLIIVVALAGFGLRRAVERPRGFATDGYGEDVLRARSVNAITCAVGLAVWPTLGRAAFDSAGAVSELSETFGGCYQASTLNWWTGLLEGIALVAWIFALWCLLRFFGDDRRLANRHLREERQRAAAGAAVEERH